jgi:hypothetical protein
LSSVNSILCTDVDGDGKNEIILTGNFLNFKPEVGCLDANYGQLYKVSNDSVYVMPYEKSGINIKGEVRSSLVVNDGKGAGYLLFGRNNSSLIAYKIR